MDMHGGHNGGIGSSSSLLMDDDMIAYFEACEEDSNSSSRGSFDSEESSYRDGAEPKPAGENNSIHPLAQGFPGRLVGGPIMHRDEKSHASTKSSCHGAPLTLNHVFKAETISIPQDYRLASATPNAAAFHPHVHVATFLSAPAIQSVIASSTTPTPRRLFSDFVPSDEVYLRKLLSIQERQDEVLFDALCCLRLGDNRTFEYKLKNATQEDDKTDSEREFSKKKRWCMRRHVVRELKHLELLNFMSVMQSLLDVATDIADLSEAVNQFRAVSHAASRATHLESVCSYTLGKDIATTSACRDGTEAIGSAGFQCLSRFFLLVEKMLEDFFSWVLELLEFHRKLHARRKGAPIETALDHVKQATHSASLSRGRPVDLSALGSWSDCSPRRSCGNNNSTFSTKTKDTTSSSSLLASPFSVWMLDLSSVVLAVEQNALPLRRWLTILEQTSCLEHLHETLELREPSCKCDVPLSFSHIKATEFGVGCARTAAELLDFLVIRSSALQDTSQMDLYRCYMMLTAHLSWPFVELSTAAMYGFVINIDSELWRQLLPRMFRISFSHMRVHGNPAENPTDVLSLILNCIEYPKRVQNEGKSNVGGVTSPSEISASALFSARSFIVQSFSIFARRKKQIRRSVSVRKAGLEDLTAPTCSAHEFPCVIPLGFIMLEADVLPPVHRLVEEEAENSSMDSLISERKNSVKSSLWRLQLIEENGSYDIGISKKSSVGHVALGEMKVKSSGELWINASIPAARWLTAALLIPFGITVQQLQRRRLKDLYHIVSMPVLNDRLAPGKSAGALTPWLRGTEMAPKKRREDNPSKEDEYGPLAKAYAQRQRRKAGVVASSSWRWHITGVDPISLKGALRLLMDVALCRDRERLVDGFLRELLNRGQWWSTDAARSCSEYSLLGTASIEVSAAFSEAVRGIPHAELVQLVVLPPMTLRGGKKHEKSDLIVEEKRSILEMFSAFQLRFSFPEELALVLFPEKLSVFVDHSLGVLQSSYNTLFWHHRKGRSNAGDPSVYTSKNFLDLQRSGLSFSDIWSYVFGYLGALYYSQMALREQRKLLQITDVQAHGFGRVMGKANPELESKRSLLSRGIGGTFYSLSFVIDTLLGFTLHEVHTVIYTLESVFCHSDRFSSCTHLSHQLDHLLLHLHMVCFPTLPPLCFSQEEVNHFTATGEAMRESVTDLMYLALDPTRFSLQVVSMRTKRAVEALVAVISGCATTLPLLHNRLKPLLTLLTFNNYYGDDHSPYRFR